MKRYLILFTVLICSCSSYDGSKDNLFYDKIEILFDGRSQKYDTRGEFRILITDSSTIQKLNVLKNESKPILFGGRKGNDYSIDLLYQNSSTGDKLFIRILKNIELKPTVIYGAGTIFDGSHRNESLVDYVTSIIKLDAIKKYNGELTQEKYEELIKTND